MSRIFSEKQEAAIMEIATEEVTRALKKGRREWPRLWPRVPPPHRRGYNPEDPSIKPPPTPSPPPPVLPLGKIEFGPSAGQVSIVINMSEDWLREIIQEEIRIALNATLDAEAQESLEVIEKASETISVRLGNPSAASRIPTVPFPEITAEDVQARIEELDGEDARKI